MLLGLLSSHWGARVLGTVTCRRLYTRWRSAWLLAEEAVLRWVCRPHFAAGVGGPTSTVVNQDRLEALLLVSRATLSEQVCSAGSCKVSCMVKAGQAPNCCMIVGKVDSCSGHAQQMHSS
jgi:hypothetical protein